MPSAHDSIPFPDEGVEEGRVAYDNVRKVIYLLVSAGAAEVLLIGVAFAVGAYLPLPFWPVQLLWLNLVTNGIQGVALAFEPGEEGVLERKPRRPSEPIFNRLMIERTLVAAVVMAVVGAYVSEGQWQNLVVLVVLSAVGYGLLRFNWPRAPFVIGIVLGKIAEESLHKALELWGLHFFTRPLSLVLIGLIVITIGYAVYQNVRPRHAGLRKPVAS